MASVPANDTRGPIQMAALCSRELLKGDGRASTWNTLLHRRLVDTLLADFRPRSSFVLAASTVNEIRVVQPRCTAS
eukprot:779153-Prymnesium_polylepis.1